MVNCSKNKNEDNIKSAKGQDTLEISGNSVVFFSITNMEYDILLRNGEKANEIDEVLSDFSHYSQIVSDSLNKTGIKCSLSRANVFKMKSNEDKCTYFTRAGKENIVGAILFNGIKKPQYYFGVLTDSDYFKLIDEYFSRK
jgi:hypothetical protein